MFKDGAILGPFLSPVHKSWKSWQHNQLTTLLVTNNGKRLLALQPRLINFCDLRREATKSEYFSSVLNLKAAKVNATEQCCIHGRPHLPFLEN